jgi:4-aminobutyrate aminotransferase/(S)-3-amino-2-methylpropionate transaminase
LPETIAWIETQINAEQIACVIAEPIAGEGGFVVPEPGWLRGMAEWCGANGIVFVADEVQTGFGRTGAWFACEHEDVVPDIVVTAKGLGGGMPIAGVTGRADLMDQVHPGGLGSTFGGNPVSCAAALAAIGVIESEGLNERATKIGAQMMARLQETNADDVRGRGAMVAMEFMRDGKPDADRTKAIAARCHEQGVIVLTCGTYGNVVRLLPPLTIDESLLDEALDILVEASRR